MYCTSCGKKREQEEKYCTSCGKKFRERKEEFSNKETGPKVTNYQSEVPIILTGILSLVFLLVPFISIPLAIVSICLGISYLHKNHKFSIGSILGIITIIITIFLFLSTLFVAPLFNIITNEIEFPEIEKREDNTSEYFNLTDYSWQGSDKSILTFERNSRFVWQKNNQNTLEGKYQIYNGMDVVTYITTHLEDFGLSSEEGNEYFKDKSSSLENYYLIILSTTNETTYLCGILDDEKKNLSLKDIKTKEEFSFTIKERLGSVDI